MKPATITTQRQFNRAVREHCTRQVVQALPYVIAALGSIGMGLAFAWYF